MKNRFSSLTATGARMAMRGQARPDGVTLARRAGVSKRSTLALSVALFAGCAFVPGVAQAQVTTNVTVTGTGEGTICSYFNSLSVSADTDCDVPITKLVPITRLSFGRDATQSSIYDDGSATWNNTVSFNSQLNLNGPTAVNGDIGFNGTTYLSGNVVVARALTLPGLTTTGGATIGGELNVTGNLAARSLSSTNGLYVQSGGMNIHGTSLLVGDTSVFGTFTVDRNNTINFSGNRIQNVAAGTASTDAATVGQLMAAIADANPYVRVGGNGATPVVSGNGAVGIGIGQTATGDGAVAIGDPNTATGTGAVAIGANNTATGNGAVAIGNGSTANGAGNVALGDGAQANAANSVALGGGSVANQASTVSVGAAGSERRVVNVAAGTAATDAVNFGQLNTAVAGVSSSAAAAQTTANTALANAATAQTTANTALGNANAAIATNVAQDTRLNAIDALNATQNTRLTSLETLVGGLGGTVATNRVQANGGIAAAMAMGGAVIVPDSKVSINFNLATYRGQQGFAGSVAGRVAPRIYVTAGFAGSTAKGSTGGRVGMAFGF